MPTIVHFEIPSDDIERTKKFYTDLFDWKIEKWPGTDNSQLTSAAGQPIHVSTIFLNMNHVLDSFVINYDYGIDYSQSKP
jgi:predicted enzyme related to lactoylglutathione lyase